MGIGWTDTGYFTIVSNYVLEDTELTPQARFIYTLLVRYGRWKRVKGNKSKLLIAWVSIDRLVRLTGECERSVKNRIKELRQKELIARKRRPGGSSITYVCDPRPIYTTNSIDIKDEDVESSESPDRCKNLQSCTGVPVIGHRDARRGAPGCPTESSRNDDTPINSAADSQTEKPDKDVDFTDKDIITMYDNTGLRPAENPAEEITTENRPEDTQEKVNGFSPEFRERDSRVRKNLRSILNKRNNGRNKLTLKPKSKVGVVNDDIAEDPEMELDTAKDVWNEFQKMIVGEFPGSIIVPPTKRELGNCKKLIAEHSPDDIVKLFEKVIQCWPVIKEQWPGVAKGFVPTFYAVFTLRKSIMAMAQSGRALTSNTHRIDPTVKRDWPKVGWPEHMRVNISKKSFSDKSQKKSKIGWPKDED